MSRITQAKEAWNKGYESGGTRTAQSAAMFIGIAGLLAAAMAIYACTQGANVMDMNKALLGNHTFQLAAGGSLTLALGILGGRAIYGGSSKILQPFLDQYEDME